MQTTYNNFNQEKSLKDSKPFSFEKKNFTSSIKITGATTKGNAPTQFRDNSSSRQNFGAYLNESVKKAQVDTAFQKNMKVNHFTIGQ